MLYPLVESGYTCTGIEPSGIFSKFITERGLGNFRSIDELEIKVPKSKFDLICHFFVLEHITQPIIFLRKQIDLLKKGGKIIFEIPNVDDPLNSIYDIPAFERFYWSVAHPWYFSEKALHFLLNQLGYPFEILLDQRYDLSNHMIWARDGRPGGMGYFSSLLGEEIEVQYKQALIKNRRCDTLIGIITKDN
jgi:SAM-dependent methyltransferase